MTDSLNIRNNRDASRYELEVDGAICIATYERRDGVIIFTHTEVPEVLEGRGLASRLIRGALADVRSQGLKVVALCAFVAGYIERHPEEQVLLASSAPG
jgi:predicted GNAT family acetyltransferase